MRKTHLNCLFVIQLNYSYSAKKPTSSKKPTIAAIKIYAIGYRLPLRSAKNKNKRMIIIAIAPSL